VGSVVDKVALRQFFSPNTSVFPVSVIPPMLRTHLKSTFCIYQKDKQAKPGDLPKSNNLPEIEEYWIEKYFALLFSEALDIKMDGLTNS
jgi:hypothetical protein